MLNSPFYRYLPFLFLCLFLSGCVGYNIKTRSELITKETIRKSDSPKRGWKEIQIYEDDELLLSPYRVIAEITVTGNEASVDESMLKKMKKEAGRYSADAVIFKEWKEVPRKSVNGVLIGLNVLSIVAGDGYIDLDVGGEYVAYEYTGIAIQFLKRKKRIKE